MTQPSSVDMTFDTSLVDLKANTSFSTTESDSSDFVTSKPPFNTPPIQQSARFEDQSQETPKQSQNVPPSFASSAEEVAIQREKKDQMQVQHIPTQEAYDQWASVYDSDGNMLQSIDDLELEMLLPHFFTEVSNNTSKLDISLVDLGCGTGRNTAKMLLLASRLFSSVSVTGLDFSKGMLDVAAQKLTPLLEEVDKGKTSIRLECCDCFPTVHSPSASPLPSVSDLAPVQGVISTLVLEHVPLAPYFATLSSLLAPNGLALVTNMRVDMGRVSQAGFINAEGVKVRGSSFAHTIQETLDEATRAGFSVIRVEERAMTEEDVESGRVGQRGKKWIGVNVWYGMLLSKRR